MDSSAWVLKGCIALSIIRYVIIVQQIRMIRITLIKELVNLHELCNNE